MLYTINIKWVILLVVSNQIFIIKEKKIYWQWPEGRGEGDEGGQKGKGLVKEHV